MTSADRKASDRRSSRTPTVLTIAGSDSGGGAGIQADVKAFARCGVHGMTAITAITAQSTVGVSAIHAVPAEIVLAQVHAVVEDIGVDAVKVGMLGTAEVAVAVARALAELPSEVPVVVDPVMVAESGARLLDPGAERALVEEIVPRATVLTPNLPEARVLAAWPSAAVEPARAASGDIGAALDHRPRDTSEASEAKALAYALLALGPRIVVLTGGHLASAADLFLDSADQRIVSIEGERHPDGAAHGSGCTHSAVLAAQLALGHTPLEAARTARVLASAAVARGLRDVGSGAGPVDVVGLAGMRSS